MHALQSWLASESESGRWSLGSASELGEPTAHWSAQCCACPVSGCVVVRSRQAIGWVGRASLSDMLVLVSFLYGLYGITA